MMNGGAIAIASWHHLVGIGGGDRLHCTCHTTQVARHQSVLLQIPETVNASASMVDEIIGGLGDSDEHTYTVPVLHSHCLSASSLRLHLPVHPAPSPHSTSCMFACLHRLLPITVTLSLHTHTLSFSLNFTPLSSSNLPSTLLPAPLFHLSANLILCQLHLQH